MGIVGPALINVGNSAPVRPSEAFFPATPDGSASQSLERFGLMAPASLLALGSAEAAEVTLRNKVNLVEDIYLGEVLNGDFTDRVYRLNYSYALTGTDLGLRYATGLSLPVDGSYITGYGWIMGDRVHPPNESGDVYQPWGLEIFQVHSRAARQFEKDSNISFAVLVGSARRASISNGDDHCPMIIEFGNASSDSALRSRTTSPNGVIDARASTIRDDLERLLLASYIGSRNTFTNAATFDRGTKYRNIFRSGTGELDEGAGDFVVPSPVIITFSLVGLIILPESLVFLIAFRVTLGLVVERGYKSARERGEPNGRWKRFKAFKAVLLLRAAYELGTGESDEST
ncbi:hypothetical protein OQA88_8849 [Cercophora sp. LCS_1]